MTVFAHWGGRGAAAKAAQQMIPFADYGSEASQRLVEAAHLGDSVAASECLVDPAADVNYAGAVCLRARRAVVALREEAADEVRVEFEELRTDASALFLASHAGDLALVRLLLVRSPPSSLSFLLCIPIRSRSRTEDILIPFYLLLLLSSRLFPKIYFYCLNGCNRVRFLDPQSCTRSVIFESEML